jgi:hypothetical protein
MADKPEPGTAEYIRSHAYELATLARSSGFDVLGYLLEVAALEAENQCRVPRLRPPKPSIP